MTNFPKIFIFVFILLQGCSHLDPLSQSSKFQENLEGFTTGWNEYYSLENKWADLKGKDRMGYELGIQANNEYVGKYVEEIINGSDKEREAAQSIVRSIVRKRGVTPSQRSILTYMLGKHESQMLSDSYPYSAKSLN